MENSDEGLKLQVEDVIIESRRETRKTVEAIGAKLADYVERTDELTEGGE